MPLSPEQLASVREEIGSSEPPSDADLDDSYDRHGGTVGVVRGVWRTRLADLMNPNRPASINVPAQVGLNWSKNIEAIQQRLEELSGIPGDSDEIPTSGDRRPFVGVSKLVRFDPTRDGCLPDVWS